jgi:hypothetical protein
MDGSAAMLQHGGGGSESSGATAGDSNAMLLENLLPVLMQTFAQVLLGYLAARRKLMPPAGTGGLGRFAAAFALPALVFQNMAVLNLGAASVGLVLGLLAAKGIVAAIVAVLTLVLVEGDTRSWSLAALFAMLTTSQSDFAIGLPILNALYPPPVLGSRQSVSLCLKAETLLLETTPARSASRSWRTRTTCTSAHRTRCS